MPIVTKATSSNIASVMKPAVSTTMPTASSATQNDVVRRNRRLRPGIASPVDTVDRNDSPSPVAMRLCMSGLTGIGTRPTAVRCRPADTTDPRNARADRSRMPSGSATATSTPYAARKNPAKIVVALKARPEKSECVPNCEKWWCHHVASWVVSTASRTPAGSDSTARRPMRCATAAGAGVVAGATGTALSGTDAVSGEAATANNAAGPLVTSERVVGGIRLTIGSGATWCPVPATPHEPTRRPRRSDDRFPSATGTPNCTKPQFSGDPPVGGKPLRQQ
nr:hypothetical protein [Microbacterium kyungheense]